MQIYVYNQNLELIRIVTRYNSVIWAQRYQETGDCEIYLAATEENIQTFRLGYYLGRPDDNMTCIIEKIEVKTDAENGNYLTVTGKDVKGLLHQRILWGTYACGGSTVQTFLRSLVSSQIINAENADRRMMKPNGDPLVRLGNISNGLTDTDYQQFAYENLGEVIESYCTTYGYGYRLWNNTGILMFELWKGTDRSISVIFSTEMDNLVSSDFIDDLSAIKNVVLVGGEGEGASQRMSSFGGASGVSRKEIYLNKSSMSSQITYEQLKAAYPGGTVSGTNYRLSAILILIMDNDERAWLAENYPTGMEVTTGGQLYYYIQNPIIATLPSTSPKDTDKVQMTDLLYYVYLLNAGVDELAKRGEQITFNAQILPNVTFIYKEDYFLGDTVKVRDSIGNEATAIISEVVEVEDENGYQCSPSFTYTSFTPAPQLSEDYTTEDDVLLTAESGDVLTTEGS